ncbi:MULTISPECIES: hypothetical protein [unclassified Nocardia]|uniref:hypothetical protein n=1 Tax=unclassified Nocardia TaxID=2637762 RepID=UPI00342D1655
MTGMQGWQAFAVGLAAVRGVMVAVVAVVWPWPGRVLEGQSVKRLHRVSRELSEMNTAAYWPVGFPHDAPDEPLGVLEAQLTMQRHRCCRVANCARKAAAWQTLVEAEMCL